MKLYYFSTLALLLGFCFLIEGITCPSFHPRTHIVSTEVHTIHHGCLNESINHLNNSKSYSTFASINEGHPCPKELTGLCHDGWCMRRDSHFGLIVPPNITLQLTHPQDVFGHICVSNSSSPVSFPLNIMKLHEICPDFHQFSDRPNEGNYLTKNIWINRAIPDTGMIHVQLFKDQNSAKEVFLGGGSLSVHPMALAHRAKFDGNSSYEVNLSNGTGKLTLSTAWKGALVLEF